MSYNVLRATAQLGIKRFAQASSINAIGGYLSNGGPTFDYFPVNEEHKARPHDAYSLSKLFVPRHLGFNSEAFEHPC